MNKILLLAAIGVLLSFIAFQKPASIHTELPAAVASASYSLGTIEVVDTTEERERGLGGRTIIPEDYGMLFVFPETGNHGFWMQDMIAPIDIIWLSSTNVIVGIEREVAPSTYPHTFYPPVPVSNVLEVRAGLATERGWKVGTALSLPD